MKVAALVLLLALTACQSSKYHVTYSDGPTSVLPKGVDNTTQDLGNGCYLSTFNQPKQDFSNKVDLLFVPDTSRSVFKEREAAADAIGNFVAALPQGADYRIGVILAHGSTSAFSGRLYMAK